MIHTGLFLFWRPRLIVSAVATAFSLLVLAGSLHSATAPTACSFGSPAGELLKSALLAVTEQVLQTCIFDHELVVQSFTRMLVSFWLLLLIVAGAVLLNRAFRR